MTSNNEYLLDSSLVDDLFRDLEHPNPSIHIKAYLKMVSICPEQSLPRLIDNLNHQDILLRRNSVKALGAFGLKALPLLVDLFYLKDDRLIKTSFLKVFVKIAANLQGEKLPEEVIEICEFSLKDENPEIILTAIQILRQIGGQGIPLLIKAAKANNPLKAKAALTALSELKDERAIAFLEEILDGNSIDELIFKD